MVVIFVLVRPYATLVYPLHGLAMSESSIDNYEDKKKLVTILLQLCCNRLTISAWCQLKVLTSVLDLLSFSVTKYMDLKLQQFRKVLFAAKQWGSKACYNVNHQNWLFEYCACIVGLCNKWMMKM